MKFKSVGLINIKSVLTSKEKSLRLKLEIFSRLPDYKCSECGQTGSTQNRLAIKEPPPVLTIQLNRFTYDA